MGKPYSDDLRERVVAAIEAGQTRVKVAKLYNMALSTVGGFIKRKRETGRVSPDKFGGYKTFALEPHSPTFRRRQQKLVQSNRCKTGPGKAVAGRPVASVCVSRR